MVRNLLIVGGATLTLLAAVPAEAAVNVASSSNGATFVDASSAIQTNIPSYSAAISEANLLTDTPSAAFFNGDTRYIFANGDTSPFVRIDLGSAYTLGSFGATFHSVDRRIPTLQIAVSNDLNSFTDLGGSLVLTTNAGIDSYTFTPTTLVNARYVRYSFGLNNVGCTGDNCGGAGVYRLSASAVPEPATWAMMLVGFGMIGFGLRSRRKQTVRVTYA